MIVFQGELQKWREHVQKMSTDNKALLTENVNTHLKYTINFIVLWLFIVRVS